MAKAYEYHFTVNDNAYIVYAASLEDALVSIEQDIPEAKVLFVERKPF